MFSKKHLIWILALMAALVLFACSDDDEKTPTGGTPPQPTPTVASIAVPAGMQSSGNSYAQQAVTWVTIANVFISMASQVTAPGKINPMSYKTANAFDSSTWSYTTQGLTFSIIYWDDALTHYWDLRYDGTDGVYTYDDWLVARFVQKKDGTGGSITVYETNTTTVEASVVWTYIGGVYTVTLTSGTDVVVIVVNADGSGTLDYTDDGCLELEIEWAADGSGSWVENDCGQGSSSGTWAAAGK